MKLHAILSIALLLVAGKEVFGSTNPRRDQAHRDAAEKHGQGHPAGEAHIAVCDTEYRGHRPPVVRSEGDGDTTAAVDTTKAKARKAVRAKVARARRATRDTTSEQ